MAVQRSCGGQSSASGKLTYFMKLVQRLLDSNMAPFRLLGVIKKAVCSCIERWWVSPSIGSSCYYYCAEHCYSASTVDERVWQPRGTGHVCIEDDDTFEKLLASKNYHFQKGTKGGHVEKVLPTTYLSIFSVLMEGFYLQVSGSPTFYQYVTNLAFETLLEETFKTTTSKQAAVEPLTYEEGNVLRYVAG